MRSSFFKLCLAGLLALAASAQSDAAELDDPRTASGVRTDIRPGASGPPTRVSVGIFMVDLTEISDPNQT